MLIFCLYRFQIITDSEEIGYEHTDVTIRVHADELKELQEYLNYLSQMLSFEMEHLDGDLSVETKHFCLHLNHIEKKALQLIHRLEISNQNRSKFSCFSYFQRTFDWIRLDIEQGTKDRFQVYAFILLLEAIFLSSIFYFSFPSFSKIMLIILSLIVLHSFLDYYHEQMNEFEAEQDRQQMMQSLTSKDSYWLAKYMPWKTSFAFEAMPRIRQQFKPRLLDLVISFTIYYHRFIWKSMIEFLSEFIDFFYKPEDMSYTTASLFWLIKPFFVFFLIVVLLYFGVFRAFMFSFCNLTEWYGGGDTSSYGSGSSTTTTTNNSHVTYNSYYLQMRKNAQARAIKQANQMSRLHGGVLGRKLVKNKPKLIN